MAGVYNGSNMIRRLPDGTTIINLQAYTKGMYWLKADDEIKKIIVQ